MTQSSTFDREHIKFESGSVLYETGDPSDSIFQLSRGCVELRHKGNTIVSITERDHPLGLAGVELATPRQHTALVTEESRIKKFTLNREGFHEWLDERPYQLVKIIRDYAHLVDHFNQENQRHFQFYRDYRSFTVKVVRPLATITSTLKPISNPHYSETLRNLITNNPLAPLLSSFRTIIDLTGRSATRSIDEMDVPDKTVNGIDPGTTICSEGDDEENFFVLLRGSLSVLKGDQRIAVIDQRGSVFGEMSPALQNRRRATVRADTPSEVATIPFGRLDSILHDSPEFSHKLVTIFYKRYKRAVRLNRSLETFLSHIKSLARHDGLPEKLESHLSDLVEELNNHDLDEDVVEKTNRLEEWMSEDVTFFQDTPSPVELSDFTSRDIQY